MAALSVTNSFVAGTSIVASQMNANFTDVVNWAGGTPTLSTSGSNTTVSGTLTVVEGITSSSYIYLNGSNQTIQFEGSSADANETILAATNPTADRTITFPDATGTVALTSDITSPTWNDANNILTNSVFN
jgi:hypothetical protein